MWPKERIKRIWAGAGVAVVAALLQGSLTAQGYSERKPLMLLISVDGMKPEAVLDAEAYGLKLPNLRALLRDGAYAQGVVGVLPTLTYPSHTTLMTGVAPARHGIYANTTFDPLNRNQQGWYWYSEDVKVPTLWDAARAAGLKTANVYWPVSVGAGIDLNLPQIWRTGTDDDLKLQRAVATPGLEQKMVKVLGRYPGGMEETVDADEVRAKFAERLMQTEHPNLITVYLTGLDTEQHASGPFSAKANAVLERLDAVVGALRKKAETVAPGHAIVCVVSDHGFAKVEHDVNLYAAFVSAGLISVDGSGKITDWKASPWPSGGSAAVMLKDPADAATREAVRVLLAGLQGEAGNGIDRVLNHAELARAGGFPDAAFFVSFRIGYELGYKFTGALVTAPGSLGMHGYLPENRDMRSSFFLVGPGVTRGKTVGEIDMRAIAPTLAGMMGLRLSGAEVAAVGVR